MDTTTFAFTYGKDAKGWGVSVQMVSPQTTINRVLQFYCKFFKDFPDGAQQSFITVRSLPVDKKAVKEFITREFQLHMKTRVPEMEDSLVSGKSIESIETVDVFTFKGYRPIMKETNFDMTMGTVMDLMADCQESMAILNIKFKPKE